jgi:hypothetical protein
MLKDHDCDIDRLKQSIFMIDMAKLMGTRLEHADDDLLEVIMNLLTKQLSIVTQTPKTQSSKPPTKKLKLDCCQDVAEGTDDDVDVVDSPSLDYFW